MSLPICLHSSSFTAAEAAAAAYECMIHTYLSDLIRVHVHDGGGGDERRDLLVRAPGEGLVHLLQDVEPPRLGLREGAPQQRRRETGTLDVQLERRDACALTAVTKQQQQQQRHKTYEALNKRSTIYILYKLSSLRMYMIRSIISYTV